jgi:transposase-like protein
MIANRQSRTPSCPACNSKRVTAQLTLAPGFIRSTYRCDDCAREFDRLEFPPDENVIAIPPAAA